MALGVASGDDNPNFASRDGDYVGFIGLQEIYSGKRVRSAFVLGGSGNIARPLSIPTSDQSPSRFCQTVSGFTNLIYTGVGLDWKPGYWDQRATFDVNFLSFWQERSMPAFDIVKKVDSDVSARRYLGSEVNLFLHVDLTKGLQWFFVGALFFPGGHFSDIKGKPLNAGQLKRLERLDRTGFDDNQIPNLGDDMAIHLTPGLFLSFRKTV